MTTEFSFEGRPAAQTPSPAALRRLRRNAEISQQAVATEMGISEERISMAERLQKRVSPGWALRYMRAVARLSKREGR
jgi:DNA-binding transcriptional regulator YiaG